MATYVIIAVNILMSFRAWNNKNLMVKWMMNPYQVHQKKEYYRFITSGFIHADYGHILFNMITFYFFGSLLEEYFIFMLGSTKGLIYFILLFLLGIIVSDIPSYFAHKNHPGYNSLGASGGVSSIVFAMILLDPLSKIYLFFIPIGIPGFIFALLYLLYSAHQARSSSGKINHSAHLYGALFGLAFTLVFVPNSFSSFIEKISSWF